jgi:glycosyltransferase involved in cell wall biosynthesis
MNNSILFLTNAYPDFEESYRGIFVKKMATLLQREGYAVSVVTPKIYQKSAYFEEQNGIKVYRFPFLSGNRMLIEYQKVPYLRMLLYYITGFSLTVYVTIKNRCQLVHVHWAIPIGLIGVWVRSIFKNPLLVTIHGSDLRLATKATGLIRNLFLHVCKKANHISCVSDMQMKEIEQLGIAGSKISLLPMGVDEVFLEAGKKRGKKAEGKPFTVMSNRNLLSLYNVSLLIRAIPMILRKNPGTRFIIAGDGPERDSLEEEAKKSQTENAIQFLGSIPHQAMPKLLSETDIYVSTSLHDGTSVSLLEAIGAGAFPIVTDIPANREWIKDGENGFLVPIDEEQFLAQRIVETIENRKLIEKSRMNNIKLVEEKAFWPVNMEKIKKIYSTFVDPSN